MTSLGKSTALVTGAGGALGSVVVRMLKDAGTVVAGTYRGGGPENRIPDHLDLAIPCDVTREQDVIDCFDRVTTAYGGLDIVVHTVGGFGSDGNIEDTSIETWNRMIHMNLSSSFLVVRQALRTIAPETQKGRIVLLSAASAFAEGPGAVAYRTSKAGLQTIIRIAGSERRGLWPTINGIAPGVIDTPDNRHDMPDADRSSWVTPEEIAAKILHLCSPAGGSVTGAIIPMP